jgi:LuxR family maltose regulon positive regulatory protein
LLDRTAARPVTIVSAPAGWGKTTLLASWARARRRFGRVAWLSVRQRDSTSLWDEVARATRDTSTVSAPRTGTLNAGPRMTVILDDLHELTCPRLLGEVEDFVLGGFAGVRLILGCRTDQPFDPDRWRSVRPARLRAAHLSFTAEETAHLLSAHGIQLGPAALAELHATVEGWPVGLRLAALALQGRPDPDAVVSMFTTNDRAVTEYLACEVLDRLTPQTREAARYMSIPDRVNADLATALTGGADGARTLAELHRAGLFIAHGRGPSTWYRLHPMLGKVLYRELQRRRADLVRPLHRRAAAWYALHGMAGDAVRQALAAEDWNLASAIVESQWPGLIFGARARTTTDVVPPLPSRVGRDPRLALAFAAERLDAGDLDATGDLLRLADRSPSAHPAAAGPIRTALRIARARLSGDPETVLAAAPLLLGAGGGPGDPDGLRLRSLMLAAVGGARLDSGDLAGAEHPLREALTLARTCGLPQPQLAALRQLAALHGLHGSLTAAARTAREAIAIAVRHGLQDGLDAAWAALVLADVCHQRDRLDVARYNMDLALHGNRLVEPALVAAAATVRARVRFAAGDADGADGEFATLRRKLPGCRLPSRLRGAVALTEAELRLRRGDGAAARRVLAGEVPVPYAAWGATLRARLDLAEERPARAAEVLTPYLERDRSSLGWTVDANVLHAQALSALGNPRAAVDSIGRALRLAATEDVRAPFVSGGAGVRRLLAAYLADGGGQGRSGGLAAELIDRTRAGPRRPVVRGALSEREQVVLRLIVGRLSAAEIATALCLSVNTVKSHTRSIYRKLDAHCRRDLVKRAEELGWR